MGGPRYSSISSKGTFSPASLLGRLRNSRTFTLALYTVVVVLLFSDQNLMAPNMSQIADEFGLTDEVGPSLPCVLLLEERRPAAGPGSKMLCGVVDVLPTHGTSLIMDIYPVAFRLYT